MTASTRGSTREREPRPGRRGLLARAGRRYVSGATLDDLERTCRTIAARHARVGAAYWNPPGEDPRLIARANEATIARVRGVTADVELAVKAPSVRFEASITDHLAMVARDASVRIHFDSHAESAQDRTLELAFRARALKAAAGVTLPSRWRRSAADARLAVDLGAAVRLVKGQWRGSHHREPNHRGAFLDLARDVTSAPLVKVATHDAPLARDALRILTQSGTRCELELLYGLPSRAPLAVAEELGVPVRFYVPYGYAWAPYAASISALFRRPIALWWLLTDLV